MREEVGIDVRREFKAVWQKIAIALRIKFKSAIFLTLDQFHMIIFIYILRSCIF
jgi:hypothetical protein